MKSHVILLGAGISIDNLYITTVSPATRNQGFYTFSQPFSFKQALQRLIILWALKTYHHKISKPGTKDSA